MCHKDKCFYQNQFYSIQTEKIAADPSSDTFESVRSSLVFNLAKWPLGALDPLTDNRRLSRLSLVQLLKYCALIGRELHSDEIFS